VGQKGVRIQAVMEEINGERVDMLEWSDDAIKLISTALQPAAISAVIIVNDQEHFDDQGRRIKKRAAVFVEEAQRPMAIGKKGQNIRLATDLTGFELDMYNYEELPAFKAKLAELRGGAPVEVVKPDAGDDSEVVSEIIAERSTEEKQELVMETSPAPASETGEGSNTPDEGQPLAGEGAIAA
jgi:N utilization substance protein A